VKHCALTMSAVMWFGLFAASCSATPERGPDKAPVATADEPAVQASAESKAFDPRSYQDKVVGSLTQVLVLGVPHLSGTPEDFDVRVLEPLLARLNTYAPDVIAIENLSGKSLFTLQAYESVYPGVAAMFGSRFLALASDARTHAGVDTLPQAEAAVRAALASLGKEPAPAERRRLALLFLASADPNSAVVQWWRLPASERKPADDIPEALVEALERLAAGRNESRQIAARLAARRGLERVYPMDDHSAVDVVFPIVETLSEALQNDTEIAKRLDHPDFVRLGSAADRLDSPERALATIRELNQPATGVFDAYTQWLIMLDRKLPLSSGRVRMAEWEARNLHMAANIRKASAAVPGGRVLVVVGSAHKPWLDAYLGMMTDMRVVDAMTVLR